MATNEVNQFRRQARDTILEWMDDQHPPMKKIALADLLGYHPSQVSKSLGLGRDMGNPRFLERIAERIPELAWLKVRYYELKAGTAHGSKTETSAKRKAEMRKRIGDLEKEAIAAIKQVCEAAKRMADE